MKYKVLKEMLWDGLTYRNGNTFIECTENYKSSLYDFMIENGFIEEEIEEYEIKKLDDRVHYNDINFISLELSSAISKINELVDELNKLKSEKK